MSDASWIRERQRAWKEAWGDMYEGWYDSTCGHHHDGCREHGGCDHCHRAGCGSGCGHGYGGGGDALYNLARFHANNIHNLMRLGSLAFGGPWGGCGPGQGWNRCGCPRCSPPPRCSDPCACSCPRCRKEKSHEPLPGSDWPKKPDFFWVGPEDEVAHEPTYWFTITNSTNDEHLRVSARVTAVTPQSISEDGFHITLFKFEEVLPHSPHPPHLRPLEPPDQLLDPGEQAVVRVVADLEAIAKSLLEKRYRATVTATIKASVGRMTETKVMSIRVK